MTNIAERKNQQTLEHGSGEALAYIHDGMHVFANESYIKLFQYSDLDEVLATPFMDMVAEDCRKELKLSLRSCQESGKEQDEELQVARMEIVALDANRATFPVTLSLMPTYYEGEHCLQVLIAGTQEAGIDALDEAEEPPPSSELHEKVEDPRSAIEPHEELAQPQQSSELPAPTLAAAVTAPPATQGSVATRIVVKQNRQEKVSGNVTKGLLSQESIASALENDRLLLVYQPVVSTSAREPEFYDVHLQMRGPHLEICSAEQIARVVGNTPLGQQLDRWVIERAVRFMGNLYKEAKPQQFQLTITAQTIRDAAFSEWLASQLTACAVKAESLVLNMREVDVLGCAAEATALINKLHDGGCRVCISGYTNCEAIASVVTGCRVCFVRFDNDISEADSRDLLSLAALKTLVDSLHRDAVKVIAADVHDKETVDCLWLAEVDLVQGACFQNEAQELHVRSFRPEIPVLRNVV